MTFVARYAGRCAECSGPIVPGEEVGYAERGAYTLAHVRCPDAQGDDQVGRPVGTCPVCHLTICDGHD